MADLRITDFKNIQVSFGAIPIEGWGEGDVLTVTRESDAFTDRAGVTGDVARAATNDHRATVEIVVLASSPVNSLLSAAYSADINTPGGVGVANFLIVDTNSEATLLLGANSWIQRPPDPVWGNEPKDYTWTIRIAHLRQFLSGNLSILS